MQSVTRARKSKSASLLKKPEGIPLTTLANPAIVTPKTNTSEFRKLLHKLRSKANKAPTMEEITAEVETLRIKRYAKR